jgi:hypothetical protein
MANKADHLAQASHNVEFVDAFDTSKYSDWAATALFYAGLHYIDAFLATMSVNPGSHDMRDRFVSTTKELKPLAADYWKLKNSSRNARYYPPARFTAKQIDELKNVHLANISRTLHPPTKPPPPSGSN